MPNLPCHGLTLSCKRRLLCLYHHHHFKVGSPTSYQNRLLCLCHHPHRLLARRIHFLGCSRDQGFGETRQQGAACSTCVPSCQMYVP